MIRESAKWRATHIEVEPFCRNCARVDRRRGLDRRPYRADPHRPRAPPRRAISNRCAAAVTNEELFSIGQGGASQKFRLRMRTGSRSQFFMRPKFAFFFGACGVGAADLSAARLAQKWGLKGAWSADANPGRLQC
jgi:hypothetical protein